MKKLLRINRYYLWTGKLPRNQYILYFTKIDHDVYYYRLIWASGGETITTIEHDTFENSIRRWIKDFDMHMIPKKAIPVIKMMDQLA